MSEQEKRNALAKSFFDKLADKVSIVDLAIVLTLIIMLPATVFFAWHKIISADQFMLVLESTLFVIFAALFGKRRNGQT